MTEIPVETIDPRVLSILEQYPFLSFGEMLDKQYIGIIQNSDKQFVSMYLLELIPEKEERDDFLKLGNVWWWESNRTIPINIFFHMDFRKFRPYLRNFSAKEFKILAGYAVSLHETIAKRVRKRQVMLVRKSP